MSFCCMCNFYLDMVGMKIKWTWTKTWNCWLLFLNIWWLNRSLTTLCGHCFDGSGAFVTAAIPGANIWIYSFINSNHILDSVRDILTFILTSIITYWLLHDGGMRARILSVSRLSFIPMWIISWWLHDSYWWFMQRELGNFNDSLPADSFQYQVFSAKLWIYLDFSVTDFKSRLRP